VFVAIVQGWRVRLGREALFYDDLFHFVLNLGFLRAGGSTKTGAVIRSMAPHGRSPSRRFYI